MVSNDGFDGKATNLSSFYLHIDFEQKYPKPAIVLLNWFELVYESFGKRISYQGGIKCITTIAKLKGAKI